ncbi:hypothetical protein [Mycoplasmopsis cynos]|uniref:hypothetical protein n=1 Tax=Mycoplasmopsis cynos TaxID=171284 RepID=UPI001142B2D0|nr:hypothetical protein [Mycoplasmopsis cynos]TQC54552.1 hypothetical protein E1I74_02670 [Mycoplasmopsis cynos]
MSKYKKIFSGLGLLSISTLVGASVVACANKKPKASDSSTEAIDQNNNQGNSTTPEQEKPETPKEGTPAPEAPKTNPETSEEPKTETPKNPEMSTPGAEGQDQGKNGKSDSSKKDGQSNSPESEIKKEPEKSEENEGKNVSPETPQTPPKTMTVDEKVELLNKFIDDIEYPNKNAPAKKLLKDKVTSIKNENSTKNDDKLKKLDKLKNTLEQIKTKLANVIKEIDDLPYPDKPSLKKGDEVNAKDKFKEKLNTLTTVDEISMVVPNGWKEKIQEYNNVFAELNGFLNNIDKLKARFRQTDNEPNGKYTEAELIWQIYETVRRGPFEKKINELKKLPMDKKTQYKNGVQKLMDNQKTNHQKDVKWLLENIKKLKLEAKKAQDEDNKIKIQN